MLEIGDVVLYRLCVSEVFAIQEDKGASYYRMKSLEGDECEFRVPLSNETIHIRPIPTEQELEALLESMKDMEVFTIARTAIDKICRPVLDSFNMSEWLYLLKNLFSDKKKAAQMKKKFSQKEAAYYQILLQRFIRIFSYVWKQDEQQVETALLKHMEQVCA